MARSAQDSGNGAMLWPPGVVSVEEIPGDLFDAANFAYTIIGWQRNMSSEEVPPRWMWPFNDLLGEWFEEVERARKDKYSGNSAEDAPNMDTNELARW